MTLPVMRLLLPLVVIQSRVSGPLSRCREPGGRFNTMGGGE
jgi:hypothetical protein